MTIGYEEDLEQIERPALRLHAASEGDAVYGEAESAQRADPDRHRPRQEQSRSEGGSSDAVCSLIRCVRGLSRLYQALGQHAPRPGAAPGMSRAPGEAEDPGEHFAGAGDITVLKQIEGGLR